MRDRLDRHVEALRDRSELGRLGRSAFVEEKELGDRAATAELVQPIRTS
jgi:hypothetical protein